MKAAPPHPLNALLQTGLAHHQAGRLSTALEHYRRAFALAPRNFDVVHLAGTACLQLGRFDDAVSFLSCAHRLQPGHGLAAMRLGLALRATARLPEALVALQKAATCAHPPPEVWLPLALTHQALGHVAAAVRIAAEAVRRDPRDVEAQILHATCLADTTGFAAALPHLLTCTELAPERARPWMNLGLARVALHDLAGGVTALDRALALEPSLPRAHLGRALALQQAHRIPEAIAGYDALLATHPQQIEALSARLLCLHYVDDQTPADLWRAHRAAGETLAALAVAHPLPPLSPTQPALARRPDGRRRLAFLSPDLRRHSVAYFLAPLLEHLDRTAFEVVLYHDHVVDDDQSARLRAHSTLWRNFAGQPDLAVAAQIRADAPDILVDLAGHTGVNRLALLAHRLAPLQVSYLGYPDTTGLRTMDYRFVDAVTDPAGESDRCATEALVRFAPTAWAYSPSGDAPVVTPPPCTAATTPGTPRPPPVFGCFNTLAKLSDTTLRTWAALLDAVPDARLLLKGHGLDDPFVREPFLARLNRAALPTDRIDLLGRTPGHLGHLALYARVDVALDPFPYAGTTTTCEALWMGRPVVTLAGDHHAARVGASLLTALGRPQWIATTPEDYVRIARELVDDRPALASTSATLRAALRASPLLDHAGQAQRFGAALLACWQEPQRAAA